MIKRLLLGLVLLLSVSAAAVENGKLVIGVVEACPDTTNRVDLSENYCKALGKCGYVPFVIPALGCDETIKAQLERCDIVLMTGGEDVDPSRYGESRHSELGKVNYKRDEFEYRLLKIATEMRKPLFGICRGEQILNCFFGGTVYQDLPSEFPMADGSKCPVHRAVDHEITVLPDTRLASVVGANDKLFVNSWHHQAVDRLAPGWRVAALSDEGVVEAIESVDYPAAGVQFHPEMIIANDKPGFDLTRISEIFRQLPVLVGVRSPSCDEGILETMRTKTDDESLLKALVAVPSVTTDQDGCNRVTEMMQAHLEANGLFCTVETNDEGRKVLFACSRKTKVPDVLISVHLDTAPQQSLDQFRPVVTNGVLYGRGASDCKGHSVLAARLLRELKDRVSIGCIFASDEERGGSTTKLMIDRGYGCRGVAFVLDMEPYSVTTRQKGMARYKITAEAAPRHLGLVEGEPPPNAIQRILKGVARLEAAMPKYDDGSWRDCFSISNINGGGTNAVCDVAFFLVADEWEKVERMIAEAFPGCAFENARKSPAVWLDESDPVLNDFLRRTKAKLCDRPARDGKRHPMLGKDGCGYFHLKSTTDARWLTGLGVPLIITGTDCHGAHTANEHMILSSMQDYFELISEFLLDRYQESK